MDKEKAELMEKIGARKFKRPMAYHIGNYLLSEEFIEKTPIEKLEILLMLVVKEPDDT